MCCTVHMYWSVSANLCDELPPQAPLEVLIVLQIVQRRVGSAAARKVRPGKLSHRLKWLKSHHLAQKSANKRKNKPPHLVKESARGKTLAQSRPRRLPPVACAGPDARTALGEHRPVPPTAGGKKRKRRRRKKEERTLF